jgi:TonB family protein
MAPKFLLPLDLIRYAPLLSEDRRVLRRWLAVAAALLLHAGLIAALIQLRVGGPPLEPEAIRVTVVFEPAQSPPVADMPSPRTPAIKSPPALAARPPTPAPSVPQAKAAEAPAARAAPSPPAAPAPTEPSQALKAPAPPTQAPAHSVAGRATMTAPETREIVPPSPYLPYTPAQREALDKSFFVGRDDYSLEVAQQAIHRSARSKPATPLTAAHREKLQKEFHTGVNDNGGAPAREKEVNVAAAASKHAPALTAREWDKLSQIYRVGQSSLADKVAYEAIHQSALSVHIALADQQKALEAMYHPGTGTGSRSNVGVVPSRTEARLLEQKDPELPADLSDRAFSFDVAARLSVGVDGSVAAVVLAGPTPEPYLNQALIAALQKWRFYPAVEGGKPVISTVEIRFTISAPSVATDKKGRVSPEHGISA